MIAFGVPGLQPQPAGSAVVEAAAPAVMMPRAPLLLARRALVDSSSPPRACVSPQRTAVPAS